MIILTEDNITDVINNAGKPVFVDFNAEWCGPCRMIDPIIEELANEYGDQIEFLKVNVDENPISAASYGVRSIPTLLFITVDGKEKRRQTGALPKNAMLGMLKTIL